MVQAKPASVSSNGRADKDGAALFWENFSVNYARQELSNFQGSATAYSMTGFERPGARCLEVGCASGTSALIAATNYLSTEGNPVLVTCDFSKAMVEMCAERFAQSDFVQAKGNKAIIDKDSDFTAADAKVDIDAIIKANAGCRKFVYGCRASGTGLPFPDAFFDCYVSALVLQLISDPVKQIHEAYRVLKAGGGRACFTVWGERDRSLKFTLCQKAMQNLGMPLPDEAVSNFDVGANIEETRQEVLKAGFNQVKHWRQAMNQLIRDGEAFVDSTPQFPKDRELTDDEKKLRAEMVRLYDELSGKDSFDLATFEIIVIVAFKD